MNDSTPGIPRSVVGSATSSVAGKVKERKEGWRTEEHTGVYLRHGVKEQNRRSLRHGE